MPNRKIPDLFLGALLAVAIFAIGVSIGWLPSSASHEQSKHWWTDPVADFTLGLVLVGVSQVLLFYVQLKLIRKSSDTAENAAKAALAEANATIAAERAYVKMSHPAPGIEQLDVSGLIWFTIAVKNYGRTPARVTDVIVKPVVVTHGDPLPKLPDYEVKNWGRPLRAFLVTEEEFFDSRFYNISTNEMSKVKNLLCDLYLIGFVDYIDQFGQRYRGGYARIYYPMIDIKNDRYKSEAEYAARNNLGVVAQEGYNYDRPRSRGEGKDWNETS